ncbi:MAG TPA: prephenate dehydrogenase/arogenate dehydrogenase family protein [Rugosimonospora sp.]|nr:prephenate dehydrogenase/arogenate dehydrogenase family protein [Rugosimonospora sp.]
MRTTRKIQPTGHGATPPVWQGGGVRIAVVGLGLIGGSVLRALAARGHTVFGYDADPATRAMARTASAKAPTGGRWQITGALRDAVAGTDLVVCATPLGAVGGVLDELAGSGYSGLVTDVTSVKSAVREMVAARAHRFGRLAGFVGGHPMAGKESAGFAAADPDLFTGCAWVLCLEPGETDIGDWLTLAGLVTALGARVVPTTAAEHDRAVARVSHVPHLVAVALAAQAAGDPLALTLAAGSFRDGTRVAASPLELIAAMTGGNAGAVREALDDVLADLGGALAALEDQDPIDALREWLVAGTKARSAWPTTASEAAEIPADPEVLLRLGRAGGWVTAVGPDLRTVTAARPVG